MGFEFTPLTQADLPLLCGWLNEPHVSKWWDGPVSADSVAAEYGEGASPSDRFFMVILDGEPIGLVQTYPWAGELPDYERAIGAVDGEAGIDYLIGDASQIGSGVGPRMLSAFIESVVFADPRVTGIRTVVAVANRRSWRCLENLGFTRSEPTEVPTEDGPQFVLTLGRETDNSVPALHKA